MERARPSQISLESLKVGLRLGILKLVQRGRSAIVRPKFRGQATGCPWRGRTAARARHSNLSGGRRP